jgi:hypothetical protein
VPVERIELPTFGLQNLYRQVARGFAPVHSDPSRLICNGFSVPVVSRGCMQLRCFEPR